MSDLVEFLRARLDEDRAAAEAASPGPWRLNAEHDEVLAVDDVTVAEAFALSGRQLRATAVHIARHDPARVLAEVEAKQQIIAGHPITRQVVGYGRSEHEFGCENCHDWDGVTAGYGYCATLRALALPYADHPEYREEWRP